MDTMTQAERSVRMSMIGQRNTAPELTVRRIVRELGYRYRLHRSDLPGRPDICLGPMKKAIFVHGCFWHRHDEEHCPLTRWPKSRVEFWKPKLEGNRQRDMRNQSALTELGWRFFVVWECELRYPEHLMNSLALFLGGKEHAGG